MKWEDFRMIQEASPHMPEWTETDIECPKCGEYIYMNTKEVLTSNPPKRKFLCESCGWTGIA